MYLENLVTWSKRYLTFGLLLMGGAEIQCYHGNTQWILGKEAQPYHRYSKYTSVECHQQIPSYMYMMILATLGKILGVFAYQNLFNFWTFDRPPWYRCGDAAFSSSHVNLDPIAASCCPLPRVSFTTSRTETVSRVREASLSTYLVSCDKQELFPPRSLPMDFLRASSSSIGDFRVPGHGLGAVIKLQQHI